MSDADGWTRRGVIGAGSAMLLTDRAIAAAPADHVRTAAGDFHGDRQNGVTAFRGIRYGRAERFRAPLAEAHPGKKIEARVFGPVCPQSDSHYQPQSEDCLFLNIW